MPSSSLFLRSSTTLVSILSLFSATTSAASSNQYTNVKTYAGNDFYNGFNFFTNSDPTHGFVTYVDKNTAVNSGLTRLDNGVFRMGVDSDNVYDPNGSGRPSVRLESKDAFTKGLFIIDLLHMPGNVCGIWPAFWTTVAADTWPVGGEIDIVESVNNRVISNAVLHDAGVSIINSDASTMTGTVQTTNCTYDVATGANAAGCAIANTDPSYYGTGLNNAGGRIFAMEWTDDTIKVWSFPRNNYPRDIDSGNPNPSGWGLPVQNFAGSDAHIKTNFFNHKIVINTDFCGDFGNAVWSGEGCAASTGYTSCNAFAANNPAAFVDQYWEINSLKVFQRAANSVSTTSSSSSSTISSTTISTSTSSSTSATTSTSTNSFGFTRTTLSSTNSGSTTASAASGTTSSSTLTGLFTGRTSSGFIFTNSSSTIPSTTTASTSSYVDPATLTTTSSTSTWSGPFTSGTWSTGTYSTGTSTWSSRTGTAVVISATGFPGFAQGGGAKNTNWANWGPPDPTPTFITTTITTSYFVPCSTGLSTSTVSIVTSFAGGKKVTYTPKISVTTYTTSCPIEWGFGGVVTITAPVTTTKTIISVKTGNAGSGKGGDGNGSGSGSGNGNGDGSGSGWGNGSGSNSGNGNGSGNGSGSGNNGSGNGSGSGKGGDGNGSNNGNGNGSGSGSGNNIFALGANNGWANTASTTLATTFTGLQPWATPDATSKDPSSGAPATGAWAPAGTGSASGSGSGSGPSAAWSSWNSDPTSPIATYKGAASRVAGSVAPILVALVAAVMGLMM